MFNDNYVNIKFLIREEIMKIMVLTHHQLTILIGFRMNDKRSCAPG